MSRRKKAVAPDPSVCCFCQQPSDEKVFGKFFVSAQGLSVHQYCMFFSANLPQNGKDNEGFEGFLEKDVLVEYRRARRMRCCVCHNTGASAGCCKMSCKKSFHYACGVKKNHLFQFFGEFRAFCYNHRPFQKFSITSTEVNEKTICVICLEDVHCRVSPDVLKSPCCRDTWFHKTCIQEQAAASGYFFRCAVCNDAEKFRMEMRIMGIFIPDRDAAWEEGGNFADLLEKYERCDSSPCKCPSGNMFSNERGPWKIVLCTSCGQYGTHIACRNWTVKPSNFYCPTCRGAHEKNDEIMVTRPLTKVSNIPNHIVSTKKTARRRGFHLNNKRAREESDDEDITTIIHGLTQQGNEDFLDSDTRLIVQRALAAGKAATKELDVSSNIEGAFSMSCPINNVNSLQQSAQFFDARPLANNTAHVHSSKKDTEDDDCVITKYIPGCRICPKCKRRKPNKNVNHEKKPRVLATSTVVTPVVNETSLLKQSPSEEKETRWYRAPFMEAIDTNARADAFEQSNEKGFETIEKAAEQTKKTAVWLVPQLNEDRTTLTKGNVESEGDGSPDAKNADRLLQNVENIVQSATPQPSKSFSNSIWMSSIEKLYQFLSPLSSERAQEKQGNDVTTSPSSDNVNSTSPVDSPTLFSTDTSTNGDAAPQNFQKLDQATALLSFDVRKLLDNKMDESENNLLNSSGNGKSVANGEQSRVTRSQTKLVFSRSDPEKTVLEAAMDHAYQLRSSGKEMTHQCLTSF